MTLLALTAAATRASSPFNVAVAGAAGWVGVSHLVAAATGYNGCPELGVEQITYARLAELLDDADTQLVEVLPEEEYREAHRSGGQHPPQAARRQYQRDA